MKAINKPFRVHRGIRSILMGSTALAVLATGGTALAQQADDTSSSGLSEIVVTAQKREQSLQDVPLAVTAITSQAIETARVVSLTDLTSLAPNLSVISAQGGTGLPIFALRGAMSQGSTPGQDRAVTLYLDGVAIAGTGGLAFDLPAVERIEVLRGPQGTLFGRNSTAGAINVITKEPSGEFGVRQQFTYGNYNQFRSATTVETPSWGPFSALLSYVHRQRDGDIKNLGAGVAWDRSVAGWGVAKSPETLGASNSETVFAAIKFEPSDDIKIVYKYDWQTRDFTPEGVGVYAFTSTNAQLVAAFAQNPVPLTLNRPDAVNNDYVIPGTQKAWGHNVTATFKIADNLTLKNVFGYRNSTLKSTAMQTGLGGLRVNGSPLLASEGQNLITQTQWSDEVQLNYESDFVTVTMGANYYKTKGKQGPPPNLSRALFRIVVPNFTFTPTPETSDSANTDAWSGFAQGEFHVMPKVLDLVAGYRLTQDRKNGINLIANSPIVYTYNKTAPSYLFGFNLTPMDDVLVYARYSSGFVSGGTVADIVYQPETVKSWEAGVKADLLDRHLRVNLALFRTRYKNVQAVTTGARVNRPQIGLVVGALGDLAADGAELEVTAVPVKGLTLNGSFGYTSYKLTNINKTVFCTGTCTDYRPFFRTPATGSFSVQYESEPVLGEARVFATLSGNWRDKMLEVPRLPLVAGHEALEYSPAGWNVNGRLALRDIDLGGMKTEVALWGKNIFNNDRPQSVSSVADVASSTYEEARTFGIELTMKY